MEQSQVNVGYAKNKKQYGTIYFKLYKLSFYIMYNDMVTVKYSAKLFI